MSLQNQFKIIIFAWKNAIRFSSFIKPRLVRIHTSGIELKNSVKNKKLSKSSKEWMERHVNDPYVKKSRYLNYRARSAFKLIEIDDKYKLLKPGLCVIELGAAPGAWSQVLVERLNADNLDEEKPPGLIIAVDILNIAPLKGVITLNNCDFNLQESKMRILNEIKGVEVDLILSDMAPNASGVKEMDIDRITLLAFQTLRFAVDNLKIDGHLLIKLWQGGEETNKIIEKMENFFLKVKIVKPPASRTDSSEIYLLCTYFKGKN